MASFYAELQVAGRTYPLRACTYEFTQATGTRGQAVANVRPGLVHLTLNVPEEDTLLDWAATAYKPLPGHVIFYDAKGGSALETLAWTAGHCVGYQEQFEQGNQELGAYVCHLTIAAPQLTLRPGSPAAYISPAPGEHGRPPSALVNPLVVPLLTPVPVTAPVLEVAAEVTAAVVLAPAITAALLLLPTNSRDDPGYKPEWDIGKLTQLPTDKDYARLDYLEAERERRTLSEAEEDELAGLLALVRKVFVGGRQGLAAYYAKQAAAAHLRQIVPDFERVELAGLRGESIGEFDGLNMAEKLFIEDKSARGLRTVNPKTGLPSLTPQQWADKHVYGSTAKRIEALRIAKLRWSS